MKGTTQGPSRPRWDSGTNLYEVGTTMNTSEAHDNDMSGGTTGGDATDGNRSTAWGGGATNDKVAMAKGDEHEELHDEGDQTCVSREEEPD
jgi:hypothetical protein